MPTIRLDRILTLIILAALTASCTIPATPSLNPVSTAAPSSTLVEASTQPPASVTSTPKPKNTRTSKATPGGNQKQGGSDASQNLDFAIPEHAFDVIPGQPSDTSITLSLLAYADQTVSINYGTENAAAQTIPVSLTANIPQEITIPNLTPDTAYQYAINGGEKHPFHTARAPGSGFTFTIQADSHLDSNSSLPVYQQTLANQRADKPDFVIDLGDTFMTDKVKPYTAAEPQYLAQRYYFSLLDAPLFLVLGNHDGEGAPRGKEGAEMSAWAANLRTSLFPNPIPDSFYSGSPENYYAWEWGDALFIVLDPYTFTPALRGNTTDLWNPTLGETQYRWLKTTLETSRAQWKFVFIHQLIGGYDKNGRGGVEVALFYEWGGQNPDGSDGFAAHRPGWGVPIHQLLVANHVTAVFHGHDHLFVKQELDGIIYQECPQPANARPGNTGSAVEYGYLSGDVLGGPGHIRITVGSEGATVEYVRTEGGQVVYSYGIQP